MSTSKLSFAKSRSVIDPARGTGASETGDPPAGWGVQAKRRQIPRNEAYIEARRSASGPEGRGMRVTQQMDVFRQTRNYSLTRVTYSPVRVSTVILVPSLTKGGTRNW
jgi:hypothetical protein